MEFLIRIEADSVVLLYCIVLLLSAWNQTVEQMRAVNRIHLMVTLLIFLDILITLAGLLHNETGAVLRTAIFYLNYILNNYAAYLWAEYVYCRIYKSKKRLPFFLMLPMLFSIPMILLNPFFHDLFIVSAANVYQRGSLFFVNVAICYFYLLIAMLLPIMHRRRLNKKAFALLIFFTIPPLTGSVIQFIFPGGLYFIWFCASFSFLLIHLSALGDVMNIDHLTGIYNRMQADSYIDTCIARSGGEQSFSGILIDIDRFKKINDTLGHVVGDDALRTAAHLLKKTVGKDAFLARYGGDEFIIICNRTDGLFLSDMQKSINACMEHYNQTGVKPYKLSMSMGCIAYDPALHESKRQFIAHIDNLMYENKREKRLAETSMNA